MRCEVVTGDIFCLHNLPGHPENRERLRLALSGVPRHVTRLGPVAASPDDLARVHRKEYLAWLEGIATGECYLDFNTYVCPDSFRVAVHAAGSTIEAATEAIDGHSCFALVRPPGHHAEPGHARGYCLLNNAAVAAAAALGSVDRVAIVDWDLHHGNGTQDVFYTTDRVLFCSVHQGDVFPGSGGVRETGSGAGAGYTLNAPLEAGSAIADYRAVFEEVFCPAIARFRPGLLLVSAGQDALSDEPKGGMALVPGDYTTLTSLLVEATDLAPALVLEGGYGPSLGRAIAAIFRGLRGRGGGEEPAGEPLRSTRETVRILKKLQSL
jgi:acetoin utilization deacetylase AcuC-like enzyme